MSDEPRLLLWSKYEPITASIISSRSICSTASASTLFFNATNRNPACKGSTAAAAHLPVMARPRRSANKLRAYEATISPRGGVHLYYSMAAGSGSSKWVKDKSVRWTPQLDYFHHQFQRLDGIKSVRRSQDTYQLAYTVA